MCNCGLDTTVNDNVSDIIPAVLSFISYTANYGINDVSNGNWNIGNLPKGAFALITIISMDEKSEMINN